MRTDLPDRLADLAEHTPPGSPPADLWDRGVRRHRVAQVGRVVVAAVLVSLIGLGGWTWHSTRPVEPAGTHGSTHLPDRFFLPSPWLRSFDGPPGPLVAIGTATRKSLFHSTRAVYGVTASEGTYGFLDLPAKVDPDPTESGPALSPDGRHVAYWTSGTITGRPNSEAVGGVAVYDAESGVTRFFRPSSDHGLTGDTLVWADDDTLVFDVGRWAGGGDAGTSRNYVGYVWNTRDGQPRPLDDSIGSDLMGSGLSATATGGLVVTPPAVLDPGTGHSTRLRSGPTAGPALLTPSLDQLVTLHGDSNPAWIDVRPLRGSLAEGVVEVGAPHVLRPSRRVYALLGWVDALHVAAVTRTPGNTFEQQIDSVDIRTGRSTHLVGGGVIPTIATGLLSAPTARSASPPRPWDQRWLVGGITCCLLVVGLYLWGATRGRRA
jgi:hypothetical protein